MLFSKNINENKLNTNMKIKILLTAILIISILGTSCDRNQKSDAYGNFSSNEIIISAESNGKIISSNFEEGDLISAGDTLAVIDYQILELQKKQLLAQKSAVSTKFNSIVAQVSVLKEQKDVLDVEKKRLENLLADSAISKQQYDNVVGQINVLDQQIEAVKAGNSSIFGELDAIDASVKLIEEQIQNSYIISPINGVVLEKYVNNFELCIIGKPVFKIADMSKMELTVYVSEDQLSSIKLGQTVEVLIDSKDNSMQSLQGVIKWISNSAEFTPKIIQTKKERVNLVYAVKINVDNDGSLKIGMPAEVNFIVNK